jgi:hypothetical protein
MLPVFSRSALIQGVSFSVKPFVSLTTIVLLSKQLARVFWRTWTVCPSHPGMYEAGVALHTDLKVSHRSEELQAAGM